MTLPPTYMPKANLKNTDTTNVVSHKNHKQRLLRCKQVWGDPPTCLLSERQLQKSIRGAIERHKQVVG